MSEIILNEQDIIEDYLFAFTKSECKSLLDFIEKTFIDNVRSDKDMSNMVYVANISAIYMKMKKAVIGDKNDTRTSN